MRPSSLDSAHTRLNAALPISGHHVSANLRSTNDETTSDLIPPPERMPPSIDQITTPTKWSAHSKDSIIVWSVGPGLKSVQQARTVRARPSFRLRSSRQLGNRHPQYVDLRARQQSSPVRGSSRHSSTRLPSANASCRRRETLALWMPSLRIYPERRLSQRLQLGDDLGGYEFSLNLPARPNALISPVAPENWTDLQDRDGRCSRRWWPAPV